MPLILDRDIKDFRDMEKKEMEELSVWERTRVIKKCKSCGQPYSYEKGDDDPKECMRCRGAEGELVY